MRPILCLRHEASDALGIALGALSRNGLRPEVADAWELAEWPEPQGFSAVATFGGSMNAEDIDAHPFLLQERTFLRRALDDEIPILGVCLGAQILARALGSPVRRAPRRELGFYPIEVTEAGRREAALAPFTEGASASLTFQWHEDTFPLPSGATLLAIGPNDLVQAYRAGSALAVQFHPEVTADELEAWFDEVGEERIEHAWGTTRRELREEMALHMAAHNERGRRFFGRFAQSLGPR
jgi:GMP synthase (glutamine-hydrolysing)